MPWYDMARLAGDIGLVGRYYVTREKGELAYRLLAAKLTAIPEGQALGLVFPAGQLMDASFADETIVRLGEEVVGGLFGDRGLVLDGLTDDSIKNLNAVIRLRGVKLAFLTVEATGRERVVGQLEPTLKETFDLVAQGGPLTAPRLGASLGMAVNTASNRLKRLYDLRLIRRHYEVTKKGLEYIYSPWPLSMDKRDAEIGVPADARAYEIEGA